MTNNEDVQITLREDEIKANREPFPCIRYGALNKSIELCDLCGWDFDAHLNRAHDDASEEDGERNKEIA